MRTRVHLCVAACLVLVCQALQAHEPHDAIDVVAVSPNFANDQTVLAGFDNFTLKLGVYAILKSTDGGVTWSAVMGLPDNTAMVAIQFSPAYSQDQTIFVAGGGGLFGTTNQGASWSLLFSAPATAMALSPSFATDNTLFLVTAKNTILKSTDRGKAFKTLAVPSGLTSSLTAIGVSPSFAQDHVLLVGGKADGIFETGDGGALWTPVTTGLTLSQVTALTFSPNFATDHTAYSGTYGRGMLVTKNGGTTWTFVNTGLTDMNVTAVLTSPNYTQDSTVYIATAGAGTFSSNSAGSSWTAGTPVPRMMSPQTPKHYRSLAATTSGSGVLLYLAMWEGLWSSTSGGASWQYIDTIPTRLVRYIHLSPNYTNDQTIFASLYGGGTIWSFNGGSTWSIRNTGLELAYTDASGISPNFANDQTAFAGLSLGLQKTTSAGINWQLLQGGLGQPTYVRGLGISPNYANDSTLLIGTRNGPVTCPGSAILTHIDPEPTQNPRVYTGLFLSKNGGTTWGKTSLTRQASSGCWGIIGATMSPNFAADKTAFAASPDTGLYKSTDGGNTWTLLTVPSTTLALVITSSNYAKDQTVFAVGLTSGVYKSSDGGSTWTSISRLATVKALDLQVSPNYANDQTFYVATVQMGLVKCTQAGSNVAQVTTFPDNFVSAVGMSPNFANDLTMFAAGYHGLYKSTDGGNTWTYTMEPARFEEARNILGPGGQGPDIIFTGNWTNQAPSNLASTYAFMITGKAGDTAVFNFVGTSVSWLSWTGPTQGSASLTLDGVSQGAVHLNAASDAYQQNVWQKQGLSCAYHTLTITAQPASGQTVSLDAFDVHITGCAYAPQKTH